MQYAVIESTGAYFSELCEAMMAEGWKPQGGVSVVYLKRKYAKEKIDFEEENEVLHKTYAFYYQAFLHDSDKAKIPKSAAAYFIG